MRKLLLGTTIYSIAPMEGNMFIGDSGMKATGSIRVLL
jgi:hypothetical protein